MSLKLTIIFEISNFIKKKKNYILNSNLPPSNILPAIHRDDDGLSSFKFVTGILLVYTYYLAQTYKGKLYHYYIKSET